MPVRSVRRAKNTESPGAQWLVNDGNDGAFDAVIVTIGTCGEPQMVDFPGMPRTHWADNHDDAGTEVEKARKKHEKDDGDRGSYQPANFHLPRNQQNSFKRDDSDEKRREKERKEREKREREQWERDARRRAGRGASDGAHSRVPVSRVCGCADVCSKMVTMTSNRARSIPMDRLSQPLRRDLPQTTRSP
jgi:hypothetical protein